MQTAQPTLFARDDTFFGICEALGQDFGFNPLYLRATFAVFLLVAPVTVLAVYAGTGVVVGLSRLAFPNRTRRAAEQSKTIPFVRPERVTVDGDLREAMALAA